MAKTLPYENLDVDASEKTIQFLLTYSSATASVSLENQLEELEFHIHHSRHQTPQVILS